MRKEFHLSDQSFYYKTFRNFAVRQRLKSDGNSCYTQTRRNIVNVGYTFTKWKAFLFATFCISSLVHPPHGWQNSDMMWF